MLIVNSDEPVFFPFSIKKSKCSGSCNNIYDPYAEMCVSDVVKNLNVKVFNLMPRTNETRYIEWHETCKCKCTLDGSICNNKQRWNDDKCRCECKALIDKGDCDRFTWNRSNCECECDKLCDIGEYLDYKNCTCRKKLVNNLIDECVETVNEEKRVEHNCVCGSCMVYIVFLSIFFLISVGFSVYFLYSWRHLKKPVPRAEFNTRTQTNI